MKIKLISIYVAAFFLINTSLVFAFCPWQRDLDALSNFYIKKLKTEKYRLWAKGGKGGERLRGLNLAFDYDCPTDIDQARKQFIEKADYLILLMNSNEKLKPFYTNYPCNISNIELNITYISKKGDWYRAPNLSGVGNRGDIINYLEMNKDPLAAPQFNIVHSETYEEAKKILTRNCTK